HAPAAPRLAWGGDRSDLRDLSAWPGDRRFRERRQYRRCGAPACGPGADAGFDGDVWGAARPNTEVGNGAGGSGPLAVVSFPYHRPGSTHSDPPVRPAPAL